MKNAFRKLIPALIMVIVSALFVGTSTYAWFSMNRKVTVTGMSVKTQVSDSLAIADTNEAASPALIDRQYRNYLDQQRAGELRPVSTVDGLNFWYTHPLNVLGNGDAIDDEYVRYSEAGVESAGNPVDDDETNDANYLENVAAGKTHYDADFQTAFEVAAPITETNVIYGYMDYTFYIKATNSSTSSQPLVLEYCNLLYNGSLLRDNAWRVAVFSHSANRNFNYIADWTESDRKAILTFADAQNHTAGKAISGNFAPTTVEYNTASTDWAIATVNQTSTSYTKVTVRLWLEGEDTTCNNETFVKLTRDYTLDLSFSLGGTSVNYLNSELIHAEKDTNNHNKITVTLDEQDRVSNGQFYVSYQWKKADGTNATGEGATSQTYTIPYDADQQYYCLVTTSVVNSATTEYYTYVTYSYLYNPATTKTGTTNVAVKLDGEGKLDNGQTPVTYKWYKDGDDTVLGTTASYGITDESQNGKYYCVITVGTGEDEVTYQTKKVTLSFINPSAEVNADGDGATVSLGDAGTATSYTWYDSTDTEVAGATDSTFAITDAAESGVYYCVVVTDKGTYTTNTVNLTVAP